MGDLTNNFSKWEFACKCGCGLDQIDPELVRQTQIFRNLLWIATGKEISITVTCGCRCEKHNAEVGGTPHSFHMAGMAVDITFKHVPVLVAGRIVYLANKLGMMKVGALGVYPDRNFMHLDIRSFTSPSKKAGNRVLPVTWINAGGKYQFGVDFSKKVKVGLRG